MSQTILFSKNVFENNDIHPRTRTLKLPHITIKLAEKIHKNGKISPLLAK